MSPLYLLISRDAKARASSSRSAALAHLPPPPPVRTALTARVRGFRLACAAHLCVPPPTPFSAVGRQAVLPVLRAMDDALAAHRTREVRKAYYELLIALHAQARRHPS